MMVDMSSQGAIPCMEGASKLTAALGQISNGEADAADMHDAVDLDLNQ